MSEPVNLELNCAIHGMAARLFPCGFDVASEAPDTLESLTAQLETGRMCVWNGASDQTIYGDAETNYAFRAWHDWAHWRYQLPFTLEGERAAAYVQVAHLARIYGDDPSTVDMAALVLAEVIGQAEEYAQSGAFPVDQVRATTEAAERLRPLAARLVKRFARLRRDEPAIKAAATLH